MLLGDRRIPRIAGRRLQRIRDEWRQLHPLCVRCLSLGIIRPWEHLDHIIPLEKGGPDFDADGGENRQGLCIPCHEVKTADDRGYRISGACGVDGLPIDARHPWNAGGAMKPKTKPKPRPKPSY